MKNKIVIRVIAIILAALFIITALASAIPYLFG